MGIPEPIRMTAEEFFKTIPETNQRIELIDGEVVYQASPTLRHQDIVGGVYVALRSYIRSNQGKCKVFVSPVDVKLTDHTVLQPDVLIVCDPFKTKDGKRIYGAPDFVVEVVSSDTHRDYSTKLDMYKKHGVREYWIVDPELLRTIVYRFGQDTNLIEFYDFDTPIPVGIYDGALSICIAELL